MKDAPISHQESVEKLAKIMDGIQFAMLTTKSGLDLKSRPMTLQQTEFDGNLWFFAKKDSPLAREIEAQPQVNLSFADIRKNSYVSISGQAEMLQDPETAQELWTPFAKAWFPDGPESPDLSLIKVTVQSADYWESPHAKVVQLLGFAKAILTGQTPGKLTGTHEHLDDVRRAV